MNRLQKPQTKLDPVTVISRNLVDLEPGIPNFSGDGYAQSALSHGWHVMFKSAEGTDLLDHMFLVNQFTGQQIQLKLFKERSEFRSLIEVNDELDMMDEIGYFFHPRHDSAITIYWQSIDKVGINPDHVDVQYVLYAAHEGSVFIRMADLLSPLLDKMWHDEGIAFDAPPVEWRHRQWNDYEQGFHAQAPKGAE
jgi:hypothetical protein